MFFEYLLTLSFVCLAKYMFKLLLVTYKLFMMKKSALWYNMRLKYLMYNKNIDGVHKSIQFQFFISLNKVQLK